MPDLAPRAVPAGRLANQPQPTLRADELIVRPWRLSDVEAVVQAYRDPEIQRWHVRTMTSDEARGWLASWPARWQAETGADWAVTERNAVVGRVGLRSIDLAEAIAELAYWTVPAARGRDIAARAVSAVSRWMLQAGVHRLELSHSTRNPASCRIAEKAGFGYEGTLRQQGLHADGWHDMHLHARLASDPLIGADRT
jgi:[ribosomal protein S5]-alanine N-acetyltransferase